MKTSFIAQHKATEKFFFADTEGWFWADTKESASQFKSEEEAIKATKWLNVEIVIFKRTEIVTFEKV